MAPEAERSLLKAERVRDFSNFSVHNAVPGTS
jgi:hypothetical protein